MPMMRFDAKNGLEIAPHQNTDGAAGFISWKRLPEIFRKGGEIKLDEELVAFQVDERGITFTVTKLDTPVTDNGPSFREIVRAQGDGYNLAIDDAVRLARATNAGLVPPYGGSPTLQELFTNLANDIEALRKGTK